MQSTRSALVFGVMLLALVGIIAPVSQAAVVSPFTTVPGPGGDVTLSFTVTGTNPMTVDVFRLVSLTQPIPAQFTIGTLVADNVVISSGVPKVMVNTSEEATNQANGFLPLKTTVSAGLYWYMLRVSEPGPVITESSIQGAVADVNPPATLGAGALTIACANGISSVEVAFTNPFDEVVDSNANLTLNPGSVKQHALPAANYTFDFLLYRVAQSEVFDVVNDPVPGNVVTTQEIAPYNRGDITTYTDLPSPGTAYAYGLRIQDTVGNLSGGNPLSQNQAISIVTPPTDVAVTEALVAGVPTNILTFTANTTSLLSDPADVSPAVIRVYARNDGAPITAANLGTSFLIAQFNDSSGQTNEVITYNHDPSNVVLPRIAPVTYTYAVIIETDNGRASCLSNSPSITTTDLLPPALIELLTPADNTLCVRGITNFSALVADDAGGSGIQSVTFTLSDATGTTIIGTAFNITIGGATGIASISFDTTTLPDGAYIYSATAVDFSGNMLETGSGDPGAGPDFTIFIDNTPGLASVLSPAAGTPVHGSFVLSGTATSNSTITSVTVTYSTSGLDVAVLASGTETWTASIPVDALLSDGAILEVTVEANDACGLIALATSSFCVDALCVDFSSVSISPVSGIFGPSGLTVSVDVVDDGPCDAGIAGVDLYASLSGFTFATQPSTVPQLGNFSFSETNTFGLTDGQSSTLVLSATDGAIDEPNSCSFLIGTITADFSAPACVIATPIDGTCAGSFIISGTAEDFGAAGIAGVTITITGPVNSTIPLGAVTTFNENFAPGVDGTYSIVVNVVDAVGNTSSCGPVNVTVDVNGPIVSILSPLPPNVGVNGAFILSGTADDLGCSGVQDMTVEYTTSTGTTQIPVTFSPVGGIQTTWSVVIPVDSALNDDDPFTVIVTAVDGIPLAGSDTETYFVDDTESCPVLATPVVNSTVFLGPNGILVDYSGGDDDALLTNDTGISRFYAGVSGPSIPFFTSPLLSSDPPALGITSATATILAGSGTSTTDELYFGLTDGDLADISICLVDGATGTANICCVTFVVNVDLTAPECQIVSPLDGACLDYSNMILGATHVLVDVTDDNSGLSEVGVTVLTGALPIFSDSTPASGLLTTSAVLVPFGSFTPGTYTIVTTVTDVAGNVAIDCGSITVQVNPDLPLSAITSPPEAVANVDFVVSGTTTNSATSATLWYPGAGGGVLPALDPSIEAAVTPVAVFDPFIHDEFSIVNVTFGNGFEFPFYGGTYNEVLVSARGVLGFGNHLLSFVNLTDPTPSVLDVNFQVPKIMPLWSDLDASGDQGGSVTYRQYDDRFIIDFRGIPDSSGSGQNDFSVILFNTGAVQFIYGANLDIETSGTATVAVGISAGVFAQDVTGYDDVFLASNGVQRPSTDLVPSVLSVAPTLNPVTDNALYEIFSAGTFDLRVGSTTTTYSLQGTSLSTPLTLSLGGNWSTNFVLPVNAFYGDGDILAMSVRGLGGCNGTAYGPATNAFFTIDETIPAATITSVSVSPFTCINGTFTIVGQLDDSGVPGYRIDSGISAATFDFYQGGLLVASVPVTALDTVPAIPTRPNVGLVTATVTVDPATLGLAPGLFGIDLSVADGAINVPNVGSAYGGDPPENYIYDPVAPKSQVVCSRLFIAAVTEVLGASVATIYELDPDTGAVLASIPIPASLTSPLGCALGYNGVNLYYAPTLPSGSPAMIATFSAITGPSAISTAYILPPTVDHITGIGADDDTVYVNGPLGAPFMYMFDANTLAPKGTQAMPFLLDTDTADIGSGIFDRTFVARHLAPFDLFIESYPDSDSFGGVSLVSIGQPGFKTVGLGFSGTRLFQGRHPDNVLREVVSTITHAAYRSSVLSDPTPFEIATFGIPNGATICAVAAGAQVTDCTLCGPQLPYRITSAVTDTAPCGIAQVDFYGFPVAAGPAGQLLLGSATTLPDLDNRINSIGDESSAAIAAAWLTQASALQFFPLGEGQISLYSISTDAAGNVETVTDALTRAKTFTVDFSAPRMDYLATLPYAARSDANINVAVTLRIEEFGSGLDLSDPPTLTAEFNVLTGALNVPLTLTLAPPVLGVITATAQFNPSLLGLPLNEGAYIDFIASATDICGNTRTVRLPDRFIVDNQSPLADDPNVFYPANAIIANGTAGNALWSMINPGSWTPNELRDPAGWDLGYILNTINPGLNAQRPDYLAGTLQFPVEPEFVAQDIRGITPEVDLFSSPSGVASIQLYFATGTSTATPPLGAFSSIIQTITEVVPVLGGGYDILSVTSAAASATDTFVWDTSGLKPTGIGSDDYYYLKTITRDHAGNLLDPVFGPFVVLDVLSPTRTIITAQALFGTRDVRIDWEYVPYDNVGVVGYEIYRTRDAVDDVLEADPLTDFDLLDTIAAYDPNGQAITEYLDETVPAEGSYAYYIAAFDAAGNGRTGGLGLPPVISNIVVADPNDLIDPYPVTNLKVRAGEPNNGNLLAWGVPNIPPGGGTVRPLGDNVAITGWEIFRHDLGDILVQSDVSDADGDPITSPVDPEVHLIARIDNTLVFDNVTPTAKVRLNPTFVRSERATISAAVPDQILLFMAPIDASRISRVWNQTTGETYSVVGASGAVVQIAGTNLPQPGDVVLVDYETDVRTYVDTSVVPGKPYAYAVVARDAAGNRSLISTTVNISDATAVAFDTTAPAAIDTLEANPFGCIGNRVFWQEAPYDQVGIIGYDAYRIVGNWPIEVVDDPEADQIRQARYPLINVAPTAATVTITLATSAVDEDLLLLFDTTRNRLIAPATDTFDLINSTYYELSGDQLTVKNIKSSGGFLHNLKVVYFNPALSLFNGAGYDGQLEIIDDQTEDGNIYTYAVQAVDPWGNVAKVSNQATDVAPDCIPPLAPDAVIQANCSYASDVVAVTVFDDDVSVVCAYDNPFLSGPAIACVDSPGLNGTYGIPIGDNQFEQVWISAIDFSGNTSPSVAVLNDLTPPAPLAIGGINLIQNAPGTDDILTVVSLDPDAVRVNVYRDDSLQNLVDSALDGDDGNVDGQWTLNLGDNLSATFFVTISDGACNESDDIALTNDITVPAAPTNVVVSNNISGTSCNRVPIDDTLTACVASDVVMLEVFADASLLTPVTAASVAAGPAGSCVGPISIGNNNSFTPGSLSGVYVVASDVAGNKSAAVYAPVDILAPEISALDVFAQFPQTPGTFPRVEDELDVQIDIDTADENEVLCVKVFTESPTLNKVVPAFWLVGNAVVNDLAPAANNDVLAVANFGADGAQDDILVAITPAMTSLILDAALLNPTALAVKAEGTGNIWVASVNPSATSEIRLSEITQAGVRVQDVDLPLAPPVTGMTFGLGDILYFVNEAGGAIYTFDTVTLIQSQLTISTGTVGAAQSIAFDGSSTLFFLDLANSFDPFSGQLQAVDVSGGAINTLLTGLVQPAGIAIDRRGGIHYGESSALYAGIFINPRGRVSELRPGATGPLTLFEGGENEVAGDTLVGPVIAADGRMATVSQNSGLIAIYTSNRRSTAIPDSAAGQSVPPLARILAQRVPGPDYRVEAIKIGDNAVHEIQAVVVDKAGNTSTVATAFNDVVGPVVYWADVIERTPGREDFLQGQTEPFSVVRAYTDPFLKNEIDREDNAVLSDRTGAFNYGEIGDNKYSVVFVAAEDEAGNTGQAQFAFNDIFPPFAPDLGLIDVISACPGTDDEVVGWNWSVEPNSWVEVYGDYELTQFIGGAIADATGAFGPISIGDNQFEYVTVLSIDDAGNVSEAVVLDGINGHPINDLVPPYPVDLSNVDLSQAVTGEDFITGLPGAVIPGDASMVRVYTDEYLTTELAGTSPILVDPANGSWIVESVGTNMVVNNTMLGFPSLWLVAEDDACNQSLPVRIDLDRAVYEPAPNRFVFNADDPNNNTIAGLEGAGGALDQLMFSTTVASATDSILGLPLLGFALTDTAGAFQAINVGRVGTPVSYVVAMDEHGNLSPVVAIDTSDRVAPTMPDISRIVLTERGRSFNDTITGLRNAVGTGEENLRLHAYADASLTSELPGFPILIPQTGFNGSPAPGSFSETSIGENYANNQVNPPAVVGISQVWLTAEDEFGNESEAARIALDVVIPNPDITKIFVITENPQTDSYITGLNRAVESGARVQVSADSNNILLYANFFATADGGWDAVNMGSLLRQPDVISGSYNFPNRRDTVYVRAIDAAGNRSAVITVNVEVVTYAVLDAFGGITLRNGLDSMVDSLQPTFLPDGVARDIEPGFYRANGAVEDGFLLGDPAIPEYTHSPTGYYRLTGLGQIVALGDVLPVDQTGFTEFATDLAKDIEVAPTQIGPSVGLYMLDGLGGLTTFGSGITPLTGVSLGVDLARDLELDYNADGTVKGGYILDGRGGLSPVGGSALIVPANAYVPNRDIYVDAELARIPADMSIDGVLVLSKYGQVSVGGPLATDPIRVNSVTRGLPNFGFNIARDLELSLDPETRLIQGTYVLDGFGGIHAGGSAPKIHDAPYFGIDVARDLELVTSKPQE